MAHDTESPNVVAHVEKVQNERIAMGAEYNEFFGPPPGIREGSIIPIVKANEDYVRPGCFLNDKELDGRTARMAVRALSAWFEGIPKGATGEFEVRVKWFGPNVAVLESKAGEKESHADS